MKYIDNIIRYMLYAGGIMLAFGCNDNLENSVSPDISGEGRTLTAMSSFDTGKDAATKGYWDYTGGDTSPFLWTGKEKLSTSIYSKGGSEWLKLHNAQYTVKAKTSVQDDKRIAQLSAAIISDAVINEGDFVWFTNGNVSKENPSEAEFTLPNTFVQNDSKESLSDYMYIYGKSSILSSSEQGIEAGDVTFHHIPSTFRFDITNNSGKSINLESIKIRVSDETGAIKPVFPKTCRISVNTAENDDKSVFALTMDKSEMYGEITLGFKSGNMGHAILGTAGTITASILALPADFNGETLTISAKLNGEDNFINLKTVTPSAKTESGHIYIMDASIDETASSGGDDIIDLSKTGTANTYIVNEKAKSYSFNATVKGNGVARNYYSEAEQNLEIEPKSVLVLWYNCLQTSRQWVDKSPILYDGLRLENGKIIFETPEEFVEGNVVIAAFAEEGLTYDNITVDENGIFTNATMLWSWNIWAVDGYDPNSNGITVGNYTLMDRNLGALRAKPVLDETKEAVSPSICGNSYQWGRKDPFPYYAFASSYISTYGNNLAVTPTYTPIKALQHEIKDNKSFDLKNQIFSNEETNGFSSNFTKIGYLRNTGQNYAESIDFAIRNPHKFITDEAATYQSWFASNAENAGKFTALWGDPTNGDEDDALKSIYDPCPPGWRLQTKQTIMALYDKAQQNAPERTDEYGVYIDNMYFPFSGNDYGRDSRSTRMFALEDCNFVNKPQHTVLGFIGWTATSESFEAPVHGQKWYKWHFIYNGASNEESIIMDKENLIQSSYAVARPVRCVKE